MGYNEVMVYITCMYSVGYDFGNNKGCFRQSFKIITLTLHKFQVTNMWL